MTEEEVLWILRERLRIRVSTRNVYIGGLDRDYADVITVKLLLDDEVISEDSL